MRMKMYLPKRKGLIIVSLLAVIQSIARFAIPLSLSTMDGPVLDNPVSDEMMMFINGTFYMLGAFGFITAFGLWTQKRWGYLGILVLSALTIVFDIWAIVTVQSSAALGIVLPALFIIYLLVIRRDFEGGGK
jgi:membrane protease YdiL (CAAX protease family)